MMDALKHNRSTQNLAIAIYGADYLTQGFSIGLAVGMEKAIPKQLDAVCRVLEHYVTGPIVRRLDRHEGKEPQTAEEAKIQKDKAREWAGSLAKGMIAAPVGFALESTIQYGMEKALIGDADLGRVTGGKLLGFVASTATVGAMYGLAGKQVHQAEEKVARFLDRTIYRRDGKFTVDSEPSRQARETAKIIVVDTVANFASSTANLLERFYREGPAR